MPLVKGPNYKPLETAYEIERRLDAEQDRIAKGKDLGAALIPKPDEASVAENAVFGVGPVFPKDEVRGE